MAEWALYLDEAGTTDPHNLPLREGQTPVFTLAGVILPLARWREYDRQYLYLKRIFFSAEIERSSKIDAVWEIKGSNILSYRNRESTRNREFAYRVIDLIEIFGGSVVGVNVLKGTTNPTPKTTIYTKALQIISERYAEFLKERGSSGIMILDSRMAHLKKGNGLDYTVAISYLSFIFGNEDGRLFRQLIEAPLFADSGLTAGLQIADIVAALTYTNVYREKFSLDSNRSSFGYVDYDHTREYWPRFRNLIFHAQAPQGAHRMFGLRTLDHRDAKPTHEQIRRLAEQYNQKK